MKMLKKPFAGAVGHMQECKSRALADGSARLTRVSRMSVEVALTPARRAMSSSVVPLSTTPKLTTTAYLDDRSVPSPTCSPAPLPWHVFLESCPSTLVNKNPGAPNICFSVATPCPIVVGTPGQTVNGPGEHHTALAGMLRWALRVSAVGEGAASPGGEGNPKQQVRGGGGGGWAPTGVSQLSLPSASVV